MDSVINRGMKVTQDMYIHEKAKMKTLKFVIYVSQVVFFIIALLTLIQLYFVIRNIVTLSVQEFLLIFIIQMSILITSYIVCFKSSKSLLKADKIIQLGEGIFNQLKRKKVVYGVARDISKDSFCYLNEQKYYEIRFRVNRKTIKVFGTPTVYHRIKGMNYSLILNNENVIVDIY